MCKSSNEGALGACGLWRICRLGVMLVSRYSPGWVLGVKFGQYYFSMVSWGAKSIVE